MENKYTEINLEGFQVVSGEMFAHLPRKSEPTCTIFPTAISFSKSAVELLNGCEHIRIEINPKTHGLLVVPVNSKDRDGVRWIKSVKAVNPKKIECSTFTKQLYETWGWEDELRYRTSGKLVTADNKLMMFFDFSNAEVWKKSEVGGHR